MALQAMTAKDLAKKVINNETLFILDVRNETDFDDWKIDGHNVEIINIPYFELMEGVDHILDRLPKDKDLLVVCAKEGSSIYVGEQLVEAGRTENIFYLSGGMKAWSEHLEPVKIGDLSNGGVLYQFVRLGKGCLSYMVDSNVEGAIIDTNRMVDIYKEFAKEKGIKIKHLIDTHLHADHISGGKKLADELGGTYYLPPKDAEEVTFDYTPLEDGKDITVGQTKIKIHPIYSPGHTIGSTSFIIDDKYLLSGDILFIHSIGRPDLAGKAEDWVSDLRNTLYSVYENLSMDLVVLPAHYMDITEMNADGSVSAKLGDLYAKNSGLQVEDEVKFRSLVTENLPPQPNAYQEIRQTNMGKIKPEEEEQREMEIGPNRCAVS